MQELPQELRRSRVRRMPGVRKHEIVCADNTDEAERIYNLLSDGGQIFMPMEETFFAWMILYPKPQSA